MTKDCGNAAPHTHTELDKWACSNVIVMIPHTVWVMKKGSVILSGYANIWLPLLLALITSHLFLQATTCQSIVCVCVCVFFLSHCICHSVFFLPFSSVSITSCLRTSSSISSFSSLDPTLCPLTQLHYTAQAAEIPRIHSPLTAVLMLFLVNLKGSFPPRSLQVCVVGPDSRQS